MRMMRAQRVVRSRGRAWFEALQYFGALRTCFEVEVAAKEGRVASAMRCSETSDVVCESESTQWT